MLIKEHRRRFMRGFGDEQSDLQAELDITNAQIQKDNDEAVRLRAAISSVKAKQNVQLVKQDSGVRTSTDTTITDTTITDTTKSAIQDFIITDVQGKTKIFGLDWYIPVGGLLGLLILLRR